MCIKNELTSIFLLFPSEPEEFCNLFSDAIYIEIGLLKTNPWHPRKKMKQVGRYSVVSDAFPSNAENILILLAR